MKAKKSEKANLEKKRSVFLQIGLLISLFLSLVAFEWSGNVESKIIENSGGGNILIDETVPIVRQELKQSKPKIKNETKFIIKENEAVIQDTFQVEDNTISKNDSTTIMDITEEPIKEDMPIYTATLMPKFKGGGISEFQKWLIKNIEFSEDAKSLGLQGKVTVLFSISKKGNLTDIKVVRGLDPLLDNEVVRVLKKSPKWTPAENNGFKVKLWYYLPVTFQIQNN